MRFVTYKNMSSDQHVMKMLAMFQSFKLLRSELNNII